MLPRTASADDRRTFCENAIVFVGATERSRGVAAVMPRSYPVAPDRAHDADPNPAKTLTVFAVHLHVQSNAPAPDYLDFKPDAPLEVIIDFQR